MKFVKALALLVMLVFIASGPASIPAYADLKSMFDKKPAGVPISQIYPIQNDEDFENVAKANHRRPYNDPQLEFEIMVPKDWISEETPGIQDMSGSNNSLIGDLARFRSPVISAMRATVTIQSVKVEHEISAENWLKNYILSSKYNLQGKVNAISEKKANADCVGTSLEGTSSYMYVAVEINGNNAVVVRFDSPLMLKDVLAFARKRIVDSFRFILASEQTIEPLKNFSFANALKFRYPTSLLLNHVDTGDSRSMSAQFYNVAYENMVDTNKGKSVSQIQGLIRFVVIKRSHTTSLKKETADIKDFVTKILGLDFRKMVDSHEAAVTSKRFLFSRYEVYQVVPNKSNPIPQEIRFVALGDKNWYILGLMFSPSESENFYAWAVNTQDFDMMIRDFK